MSVTPRTTRVLLVDDHPTVLLGLRSVLAGAEEIEVVGAVTSGEAAVRTVEELAPDLVLLDLAMPGQSGLETLRAIAEGSPSTRVLVLTASADARDVSEAMRLGASGYVLKDTDGAGLVDAVRTASQGHLPIDPRVTRHVIGTPGPATTRIVLSPREHDVLRLLRQGLTNKVIAEKLGIQESTVKTYLSNAYASIGVQSRTSAALWARFHLDDAVVR
ncbi:MAG: response regulator transcription factor [Nocardioidaceae bacterium]|nr:response regulator transcription factor [Nocardioidaceae bacterium]NUS49797.1 response regulator transcription factor [Nocardioidaceae bacterium]